MLALFAALTLHATVATVATEGAAALGVGMTPDTWGLGPLVSARLGVSDDEGVHGLAVSYWFRWMGFPGFLGFSGHDQQLSVRYARGGVSVGFEVELRTIVYSHTATFSSPAEQLVGVGPSFGFLLLHTPCWRVEARLGWLPLSPAPDLMRVSATLEVSWRALTVRLIGGTGSMGRFRPDHLLLLPFLGLYVGARMEG